jgi:hypothetical protein
MLAQHVLDLVADFPDRIERRARVLENHRDFAAAKIAHLVSLAALTSMPENITEPSAILPARSRIRITA